MKKPNEKLQIVKRGIIDNNPTLVLVLGTCPTLATTSSLKNAVTMGFCVLFVLICSNMLISSLRKVISEKVRIPAYVTIIATFVTIIDRVVAKFLPDVYMQLGLFIPLITVNCIIFARAESFAQSNKVIDSFLDGLGTGIGFTLALSAIAFIRELLGAGSVAGFKIPYVADNYAMTFFILPGGGFLVFGCVIAIANHVRLKKEEKQQKLEQEMKYKKEEEEKLKVAASA